VLALIALAALLPQDRVPSKTGDVREHKAFESKTLGNARHVWVWLPPGYEDEPSLRYPVLYMHDGQNVFDGATSFIPNQEWRADETAGSLIEAGLVQPLIIVAVSNAGAARGDEYLPTRTKLRDTEIGGKLAEYGRFLIEELKPFVDETYRTRPGPLDTGLCGSSFGGVATLSLALAKPEVFTRLGVVSPSVWWDDRVLIKQVNESGAKLRARIWLDIGTAEGDRTVTGVRDLAAALEEAGWRRGKDLTVVVEPGGQHNEVAWARRFGAMLLWLFPAKA
jgi:predicted alpha/beta superfamily hydrolase